STSPRCRRRTRRRNCLHAVLRPGPRPVTAPRTGTPEPAGRAARTPCRAQRLKPLGVAAESANLLPQDEVVAHARGGRLPDAVVVLGPRWLVVEVHRPVVAARL